MHRTVALTLTIGLAACTRGPTDPVDARLGRRAPRPVQLANPTETFNQLQAISAVTNTPLFESFTVLAPRFAAAAASRAVALTALSLELGARYSRWQTPPVHRPPSPAGRGGQRVRTAALGTTFVWDPSTNAYIASSDSGAPANGERFMLYAISQHTGLPSVPLTSIGYVDLTNASAGATGVTVVGTPAAGARATYASYSVAADGASLAGFVTDGTTRLDINVRADSTTSHGTLREQTAIAVAGQDMRIDESVTVSGGGGRGDTVRMTTDLRVASGGEAVRAAGDVTIDTTTHIGSGQMAVSVNRSAFVTITLGGPDLAFAPAPHVTLSAADETTLRALFGTSFELFGTTRLLMEPAAGFLSPLAKRAALSP
jgi:hypothetical protein